MRDETIYELVNDTIWQVGWDKHFQDLPTYLKHALIAKLVEHEETINQLEFITEVGDSKELHKLVADVLCAKKAQEHIGDLILSNAVEYYERQVEEIYNDLLEIFKSQEYLEDDDV